MLVDRHGRKLEIDPDAVERVARADGWENHQTGIGTYADKTTQGRFFPSLRILDKELTDLYNGSDLVSHIVEDRAREQMREGYTLAGRIAKARKSGSPTDAADDVLESDASDVHEWAQDEFNFDELVTEAEIWARLYGGFLLVLGVNDGGLPWEPVNGDRIESIDYVNPVDRRFAYVQGQYANLAVSGGKYGRSQMYLVSNAIAGTGWNGYGAVRPTAADDLEAQGASIMLVHESRVIRFGGNPADVQTRQQLAGWDWSVIQRVYNAMRTFEHAFDSAGYLLSDASQSVFKLQGLFKAIAAKQEAMILERARLMERTRSVMRGIILDAGGADGKGAESFERVPTSFAGVADMLDRMMMRLSAAAKEPITKLFGRSPAGMNATGDSDLENWYTSIRADQKTKLSPKLRKFYRYAALAKAGPLGGRNVKWSVEFEPLWSPTDQEVAQTALTRAQARASDVDAGIIPAEVAALSARDEYPDLDTDDIEASMKAGKTYDPHENDPPEETATQPGPGEGGEPNSPNTPVRPMGKQDAFNPDQPRDENGRWTASGAVIASRGATERSGVATMFGGSEDHASARTWHAKAATAARDLSAQHEAVGNVKAAAKFQELAAHHESMAASHALEAARERGLDGDKKGADKMRAAAAKHEAASEKATKEGERIRPPKPGKEKAPKAPTNEKRAAAGRKAAETRGQNDERAKANIPAHLHPYWEEQKGLFKGSPDERATRFMEHVEEHGRDAVHAMQRSADERLTSLIREHEGAPTPAGGRISGAARGARFAARLAAGSRPSAPF